LLFGFGVVAWGRVWVCIVLLLFGFGVVAGIGVDVRCQRIGLGLA
jgi:hypothetical protein